MSKGVQAWFKIARKELNTAQALFNLGSEHYDFSLFLCHQIVEKSIKGYLTYLKIRFPKTHDISVLTGIVEQQHQDLELIRLLDSSSSFTSYVIRFRYPQSVEHIIQTDEIVSALELAQKIYRTLLDKSNGT